MESASSRARPCSIEAMRMLLATLLVGAAVAAPVTGDATSVTATSATLNGTAVGATTASFEYGTTAAYGVSAPATIAADGSAQATVSVTPNTTYHFRIVADTGVGQDKTFQTAANPTAPGVSTQHTRDITPTSANVSASLNPHAGQTTYYFQYGTSTRYGGRTPDPAADAGSGTTAATVTAPLTGLQPYTRYHWRLVATNAAGTTRGPDKSFTTARAPTAVSLGLSRTTVAWGSGLSLGGRVSGPGSVALTVALEQQRFPFDVAFNEIATARTSKDGGYLFTIDNLLGATRFRVLTRTQNIVASPVVTARAAVRAGIAARTLSRKRARIEGSIVPAVRGTVSLQGRLASGRWTQVRHATVAPGAGGRTTYRFKVWRARKASRSYRVVALPERGAYVRGTSRAVVVSRRPRR
jgi:hypothetical protein